MAKNGTLRAIGFLLATALAAGAANTVWKPAGEGNWLEAANWTAGLPSVSGNYQAYIDNGGTAVLAGAAESAGISLGASAGKRGEVRLEGGAWLSNTLVLASLGASGTGVLTQAGGTMWNDKGLRLGYNAGSRGVYDISAGTNILYADISIGANAGQGEIRQSGGHVELRTAGVNNGRLSVHDGQYLLTGGLLVHTGTLFNIGTTAGRTGQVVLDGASAELRVENNLQMLVGNGGEGRLEVRQGFLNANGGLGVGYGNCTGAIAIQTGGTVTMGEGKNLQLAYNANGTGIWHHLGGTLILGKNPTWLDRSFIIGGSGQGVFNLGDAVGCGILTQGVAGIGVTIRWNAAGNGLLRGWSRDGSGNRLTLTGPVYMSGRVVAEGYGTDRVLDLSGLGAMNNATDNGRGESNGWYAADHGELRLPPFAVTGSNTYYWGEQADLDLVNAARLLLVGASGSLTGRLFAVDHGDVPAPGALRPVSVHHFGAGGLSRASLTLRYDHTAAAAAGIDEEALKLFQWSGTGWDERASAVDTNARTIGAANLSSLGFFAVGRLVPARGALIQIR